MPPFPFGGHPTFARYLEWAREQGCTVEIGVDTEDSIPLVKIIAPSGSWVVEAGTSLDDRLVPTTIGRLDRRLGLTSPWFGAPPSGH